MFKSTDIKETNKNFLLSNLKGLEAHNSFTENSVPISHTCCFKSRKCGLYARVLCELDLRQIYSNAFFKDLNVHIYKLQLRK